jgi:DNA topoisomerase-1
LTSTDVNAYLRFLFGDDVTAKQFRTWAGSLAAFEEAAKGGATVKAVIGAAAKRLRNTKAVARKSYVHPALVEAVKGDAPPASYGLDEAEAGGGLSAAETAFLRWLENEEPR